MNDEKKTCCCGCSQRKKERTPEEYTRLIHRLNRIEGRSAASAAWSKTMPTARISSCSRRRAGAALNAFNKELLASHIRTCVAQDIRDGKDQVIDELVTTLQKLMK